MRQAATLVDARLKSSVPIKTSDSDARAVLKSHANISYQSSMAILTRIHLVKLSCSKIIDNWSGVSSEINEIRAILKSHAFECFDFVLLKRYNFLLERCDAKETGKLKLRTQHEAKYSTGKAWCALALLSFAGPIGPAYLEYLNWYACTFSSEGLRHSAGEEPSFGLAQKAGQGFLEILESG